jgi:hypothetical protein
VTLWFCLWGLAWSLAALCRWLGLEEAEMPVVPSQLCATTPLRPEGSAACQQIPTFSCMSYMPTSTVRAARIYKCKNHQGTGSHLIASMRSASGSCGNSAPSHCSNAATSAACTCANMTNRLQCLQCRSHGESGVYFISTNHRPSEGWFSGSRACELHEGDRSCGSRMAKWTGRMGE